MKRNTGHLKVATAARHLSIWRTKRTWKETCRWKALHVYISTVNIFSKLAECKEMWCREGGGGGVTLPKIVCGCACWTWKIWFSLYNFFTKLPTHQYTIEKHPILPKLSAFYNLFKIYPNFILGLLHLWWKLSDRSTKFHEKAPQKAGTYKIPYQCETPSLGCGGGITMNMWWSQ